jgi:dTDP-4-dehydrorhamnose reductase
MIVVVGAGGLIGRSVASEIEAAGGDVLRASHRGAGELHLDLRAPPGDFVARLPAGITHAVLLAGVTGIDACRQEPEASRRLNVTHMRLLLADMLARGIVPVFVSSDLVFRGDRGRYCEDDAREPTTEYGRQKAAVEDFLLGRPEPSLIVRLSKVFGADPDDTSPVREILLAIRRGRPVRAAVDQVVCPTFVGDVASAIRALIERRAVGVIHLATPPAGWYTRESLARTLAAALGREELVVPCRLGDLAVAESRPRDSSLDSGKFAVMGDRPFSVLADHLPRIIAALA